MLYYRHYLEVAVELLQDSHLGQHVDWRANPIYVDGVRHFGPFSSGTWMQCMEIKSQGRTVCALLIYSDATQVFKRIQKHSVLGAIPTLVYVCADSILFVLFIENCVLGCVDWYVVMVVYICGWCVCSSCTIVYSFGQTCML